MNNIKKLYILFFLISIFSISGCLENNIDNEFKKVEILKINGTGCNYKIIYLDNEYIKNVNTNNLNDLKIFKYKISNTTKYQLYISKQTFGTNYILFIPKNKI